MQEIMRIGNKFVPADEYIKDISNASREITDIAKKYKADMLTVLSKGDEHQLVTQHHENMNVRLEEDLAKTISLIEAIAETYNVRSIDIADAIKIILNEG